MSHSNLQNKQTLFEIAASQYGLFTAKQAIKAGFKKNNHPYHVQVGNWVREWHGIYRLARFPLMLLNKSLFHKELSLTVLLVTFNESTIPRRVGSVFLLPTITQLHYPISFLFPLKSYENGTVEHSLAPR